MTSIFIDYEDNYCIFLNQFNYFTERIGFPYLNNDECSNLLESKNSLEARLVQKFQLEELTQAYRKWLDFIDKRRKIRND